MINKLNQTLSSRFHIVHNILNGLYGDVREAFSKGNTDEAIKQKYLEYVATINVAGALGYLTSSHAAYYMAHITPNAMGCENMARPEPTVGVLMLAYGSLEDLAERENKVFKEFHAALKRDDITDETKSAHRAAAINLNTCCELKNPFVKFFPIEVFESGTEIFS